MNFSVTWRNDALRMHDPMHENFGRTLQETLNVEEGLTDEAALARAHELQRWGHASVIEGPEGRQRNLTVLQFAVWHEPLIAQFRTR